MSGLKEQALALAGRKGEQCSVANLMARASAGSLPVSFDELSEVLTDRDVQAEGLSKALHALGVELGPSTIRRHRNGGCKC